MKNKQCRTHRRNPGCHVFQILAYLVILCFEKRHPKQKCCCLPEVKHLPPPKFWVGYTTGRTSNGHDDNKKIDNHQHDTIVTIVFLRHKTWNNKKMSIFCHFLISWLTQAWMFFLSCSTTCTKF